MSDDGMARVRSRDGTEIAYRVSGHGPPLVLVHGTGSNHTTWRGLTPYLDPHLTVCALDRRGRGASGDAGEYDMRREFEDVAAVVAAASDAGSAGAALLGHSFGGLCALGAAVMSDEVERLILYEPALTPDPPDVIARLTALHDTGDFDDLLAVFLRDGAAMSPEQIQEVRTIPGWWESRLAGAHTIARELAVPGPFTLGDAARIGLPTLLITGGDSPDAMRGDVEALAATIPDARTVVLEGQRHIAHLEDPERFAGELVSFLIG